MFSPQLQHALFCASVIFVIAVAGEVAATLHTDTACYGVEGGSCSEHNMQCPPATAFFPLLARRGSKPEALGCSAPVPDCGAQSETCCSLQESDCFLVYNNEDFTEMTGNGSCLNQTNCKFKVPRRRYEIPRPCNETFPYYSVYSTIDYVCINDQNVVDFTTTTSTSGSDIALTYIQRSPDEDTITSCRVEAEDCSPTHADVTLVRTSVQRASSPCTTLQAAGQPELPCGPKASVVWTTGQLVTPFTVTLQVKGNNDAKQAWAVIHSRTNRNLTVTCRNTENDSTFPECSVSISTVPNESSSADISTASSSTIAGQQTFSTLPVEADNSTASSTTSSSQATMFSTLPVEVGEPEIVTSSHSSSNAVLIAGIVGGVVVGIIVLCGLAVVLFLLIRFWVVSKRRTSPRVVAFQPNTSTVAIAPLHGFNSPAAATATAAATAATAAGTPPAAATTATGGAANTAAGGGGDGAGDADDYDHLGQRQPAGTAHDALYGHAQTCADVTENAYDHVSRGQQAPVSEKVIDNVYSTAGHPGAASSPEDDVTYDVAGSPHRRDVMDSSHDFAIPPV